MFFRKIIKLAFISFCFATASANPLSDWKETTAHVAPLPLEWINKDPATLLGLLIQNSDKPLDQIIEKDGKTITLLHMEYEAPIQLQGQQDKKIQSIAQSGLLKDFDPGIQELLTNATYENPKEVKIRFRISHPTTVQFHVGKKWLSSPTLITKSIDAKWEAVGEPIKF